MPDSFDGFIVHSYTRTKAKQTQLYFIGRLSSGETFAAVETRMRPWFYIRKSDENRAREVLEPSTGREKEAFREQTVGEQGSFQEVEMSTMDGESCLKLSWNTLEARQNARMTLAATGLRTYEADLRITDQYRLDRSIHGTVLISGDSRPGRQVGRVFMNPGLRPSDWQPQLSLLSIDIETDPESSEVLALGLFSMDPFRDRKEGTVFFVGEELDHPEIECLPDESSLLTAFRDRLLALDPDIITGWNVIDFDFKILADRFRLHGLPFNIGRSDDLAAFLPRGQGSANTIIIPGRQVWDGVRLLRASPERFEDYSLETVAGSVLGYGKRISIAEGEKRLDAISRLYRENPLDFCLYCLQDARLVYEIFARTGLLELTLRRCLLIGVAPDRAWTSIPAFEHLYIESMHRRGIVAPTPGVDALPLEGAPGGIILSPHPGIFDNVMVFDFQSLYPSIIRSFNIDPLSYMPAGEVDSLPEAEREQLVRAPNGACFRQETAILPELMDRFFEERRRARQRGDEVASFVYKIIMNSFYGVLGADGCRFAGSGLAGAITSFGHHILSWCKAFLERQGYHVLYGDTDSLFVTAQSASGDGQEICRLINEALAGYLQETYRVTPRFTLEYEKLYSRFFLPPLRGGGENGQKGRAKGYAGLIASTQSETIPDDEDIRSRIEIKGMEAVRRDWTDLAHDFQIGLLEHLFRRRPLSVFQQYIKEVLEKLIAGSLDEKLVYRKALRKRLSAYTRSRPPHVKAAALLEPTEQHGLIRYLITKKGPQPLGRVTSDIDYDHYVEKQLKPIASTFTEVLNTDLEHLFNVKGQLWLFEGT